MASGIFASHLITSFSWKTSLNALILLLQLLNATMNQIFWSIQNFEIFHNLPVFCLTDIRPTSGRRMVPEISHDKDDHGGFMRLSFRSLRHGDAFDCLFNFLSSSIWSEYWQKCWLLASLLTCKSTCDFTWRDSFN